MCGTGQHRCGAGCIDDLPNEPAHGCRNGCGEPCPTPPDGTAACSPEGTCTFACEPPFYRDGATCVCRARTCADLGFSCGAPDDGCGRTLDCGGCDGGGVCISGSCSCPPDAREPNNGRLQAPEIARLTDAPDSSATFAEFNLHSATDQDWFTIHVDDDWDAGNPQIRVELDRVPEGSEYTLTAWYVCDNGSDESPCTVARTCSAGATSAASASVEIATECGGTTDEHGVLWIQITPTRWSGSCAPYRLVVNVR